MSKILVNYGGLVLLFVGSKQEHEWFYLKKRSDKDFSDEKKLLGQCPDSKFYYNIGIDLVKIGVSIHMFCFREDSEFLDLAIHEKPSSLTNGKIYKYNIREFELLYFDVYMTLSTEYFLDCCFKITKNPNICFVNNFSNCFFKWEAYITCTCFI